MDYKVTVRSQKAELDRTGQDSPLERITATLAPICEDLNQEELRLLLASYSHVSCELEIHRFAQTWNSGPLRNLGPLERWLAKARPAPERPVRPGASRALASDDIERRLERIRRTIEGGEVFGERFLATEDVERSLAFYREQLEARR